MRIALKELRRQPGRFLPVGGALTLLVVLLVVLGGFLDGLELSQTGAYRAHDGTVLVFAEGVDLQIQRSRLDADRALAIEEVDGVEDVGTLQRVETTAAVAADGDIRLEDSQLEDSQLEDSQLEDIVLFGYDVRTDDLPAPPGDGGAVIDAALGERIDVEVGDTLEIGTSGEPITVEAVVDDLTQGSPTVWLGAHDWRRVVSAATPTDLPPEGTSQALVVRGDAVPATALASRINDQVDQIAAVTPADAIQALPVVQQQSSTFRGIIAVTFIVTLLVVALFFALITLERVGLYAVLKALGARSGDLLAGISAQAVGISLGAIVIGIGLSVAFTAALPAELPIRLVPMRLAAIAGGTVLTAVIGSLFTLRRILNIDPAESIG